MFTTLLLFLTTLAFSFIEISKFIKCCWDVCFKCICFYVYIVKLMYIHDDMTTDEVSANWYIFYLRTLWRCSIPYSNSLVVYICLQTLYPKPCQCDSIIFYCLYNIFI